MKSKPITIAIGSEKGGVGKTAVAVNLSAALAKLGKKVLAIDMDRQSNLSMHLLKDFDPNTDKGIIHAMILDHDMSPSEVIYKSETENLFVMPIERRVQEYRTELDELISKENSGNMSLKLFLEKEDLSYFDYIIIDNKPSLGASSISSLIASDFYLVPVGNDDNEINGAIEFIKEAQETTQDCNTDLELLGFVFVGVNNSHAKTDKVRQTLLDVCDDRLYQEISTRSLYSDLAGQKKTVFDIKEKKIKNSKGGYKRLASEEYLSLANSLILKAIPKFTPIQKSVFSPTESRA
ncbi:AAA family ATPase [Bacteriovoracaceae bacterium]|nr:AAA family ATPase [Bacteriovoracaceae bacterium]